MKREAYKHPKTLDLAARLDVDRSQAIGYLSLLWDWTADYAIRGDIGKWANGAIARGCDWNRDPDEFIEAMVAAGWLDENDEHRLIVHDWPEHCENWVKAKVTKTNLSFLDCYGDVVSGDSSPPESARKSTSEPSPPRDQTKPNQTKPKDVDVDVGVGDEDSLDVSEVRRIANSVADVIGTSKPADVSLALKIGILRVRGVIPEADVATCLDATREKRPRSPPKYFHGAMAKRIENFNGCLKETVIPEELTHYVEQRNGHP